jgi:hypothetical protein
VPRRRREHSEQVGLALGDLLLDHRVGVLLDDVVLHTDGFEVSRQHVLGKARLLLVHVHRDDLELDRRHLLQVQQHVEHGVAVLAAGQADHHLVAILDHVEVGDGFAGQAANALLQFVLVDRKGAHGASESGGRNESATFYAQWPARPTPPTAKC